MPSLWVSVLGMKHIKRAIITLLIVEAIIISIVQPADAADDDNYHQRIAGILIGEGGTLGEDYEMMACTVRNRLERGWSLRTVLRQYNARYIPPTQEHVTALKSALTAKSEEVSPECNAVYFMYATWYADRWIDPDVQPVIGVGGNNYYQYEDYTRLWNYEKQSVK